jgi:diguanylate cyclase (GGDEF)-like protein
MHKTFPDPLESETDDLSQRWIYRYDQKTIVALVTLISILLSVLLSIIAVVNIEGMPVVPALILSIIIPAIIVPIVSWRNIGLSIKLKKLEQQMRHLATWDALTGLLNRQIFYRSAQKYLDHARQTGEPFSVMMLDLDHYKAINDTYGHPIGDRVLIAFGSLLKEHLSEHNILGRIGGEEFAAVLPGVRRNEAIKLAEAIHTRLRSLTITEGNQTVPVSVSIGVACYPGEGTADIGHLLHEADRALYRAKQTGRSRTIIFPDEEAT